MKRLLSILTLFFVILLSVSANMASPYIRMSNTSEAYSSKDIDILSEQLTIKIIDEYNARFTVVYNVRSDRQGVQIPLVFDTRIGVSEDPECFKVWVDGVQIPVSAIPSTYEDPKALQWQDSLDNHLRYSQERIPNLIGMKYFEVSLSAGEHKIQVEYTLIANEYLGNPVKEYRFYYNLEPARHWRSFSDLSVTIDASELKYPVFTDLGENKEFTGVKQWQFPQLPQDGFSLWYTPDVGWFASFMTATTPGNAFIIFVLLAAIHIYLILRYRTANPHKRISPVVVFGSILLPFIFCLLFMLFFNLTDWVIGEHASGQQRYTYLIFLVYPVLLIIYWLVMWLIDRAKKRKLLRVR
ncbi:hypothetical protein M2451_000125 [Dysgonomonas sp. PFB1-18]|uniref:hypothetical protein n=1 Tax=unclassified Dysgonomonas TaxID=2630389 RepID=UPI00247582E6|nr:MULTISPECIES: hypothetical protein [unclassified Dysgonomonas]MDH6307676.1 hypothetical protein [Dysgonomonas sp. PF1-14]MDH6337594.1 hypothetical protein [Dysgonomonas sp. PF1-16]MDH6378818.1 hypothetical protein [Dysgonomonas sp. PFB1-18]MDH6396453.1 hypothetical protein [Dysgonomonas sp. PF1-23]